MSQGWSLIGNSNNAPLDVATVFGDTSKVASVFKWVPSQAKWAFFAPSLAGQALSDYANSKGYDVLATVNGGEGFWVNAAQPFSIDLPAGNAVGVAAFQAALSQGWNLISVGESLTPSQFNTALGVNIATLWAWDAALSQWYLYAPGLDANGTLSSYVASKGYLDFATSNKTLGAGVGFWVNVP
ncbi:MAG: hypothetical protein HYU75_25630 [Betaproteobacteria bacterium]|nr:hypothetical protein [Betaproteobacteria bacterium]